MKSSLIDAQSLSAGINNVYFLTSTTCLLLINSFAIFISSLFDKSRYNFDEYFLGLALFKYLDFKLAMDCRPTIGIIFLDSSSLVANFADEFTFSSSFLFSSCFSFPPLRAFIGHTCFSQRMKRWYICVDTFIISGFSLKLALVSPSFVLQSLNFKKSLSSMILVTSLFTSSNCYLNCSKVCCKSGKLSSRLNCSKSFCKVLISLVKAWISFSNPRTLMICITLHLKCSSTPQSTQIGALCLCQYLVLIFWHNLVVQVTHI
ncbi:unnamed protein product [Moneuplotes crassus]|uniref:Uncharacterized protein n=1 Tax=Euplotes crassus TaxID=5936 RepID=A0AAD1XDI3_EUPCR|nr:unnamed protein product [Moneuplotes crassus]